MSLKIKKVIINLVTYSKNIFLKRNLLTKKAFTLAEVLITIGIIGVVAAMTIPLLLRKNRDYQIVNSLKKNYSVLNQAYKMVYSEEGETLNWFTEDSTSLDILKKLTMHLQASEISESGPANVYKMYYGKNLEERDMSLASYAQAKLADGSIIYLLLNNKQCTTNKTWVSNQNLKNICGAIYVDTNGLKKPNMLAVDLFGFYLTNYSIYPTGTDDNFVRFDTYCSTKYYGYNYGCTAWVLIYGNLDYLYCGEELSTKGKHSCR